MKFPKIMMTLILAFVLAVILSDTASAQYPGSRPIARTTNTQEWNQYYHYPYIYYPQNYWSPQYFQSSDNIYHRYPPEMQVPAYNPNWQNFYPSGRKYHFGNHYKLDIF